MSSPMSTQTGANASPLLNEFLEFLRDYRGLSEATIHIRRLYVSGFLTRLTKLEGVPEMTHLQPDIIHDYVIETAPSMSRAVRKHLVSSLRSFLRFAHLKGYIDRNLVEAVPVIVIRKLDRLPRSIAWEAVQQLLAVPNQKTPVGRRNYALLLMLATYGVRIGQVTHLQLRDIDWQRGLIHFQASKDGKPLTFPLHAEVAKAVLTYIREDRGQSPFPELFLTVRGQRRPLSQKNHLNSQLIDYYRKAGIKSSTQGSHAIRHAFATRLLQQGTPIKTIADLLGHRSINTTFIYTKVEVERLRSLAPEWPEEVK